MPQNHVSTYSYRAKLGLIVPPTNTVNEAEWMRMVPEGVTFHTHRMRLHAATETSALMTDLEASVAMLAQTGADVVAYACTAGSATVPVTELPDTLTASSGTTCLTTSAAIVAALDALGAKRLAVATPYAQVANDHEAHFLAQHGFEVKAIEGLGIGAGGPHEFPRIARTPLHEVGALARRVAASGADALLLACTDLPTLALIPALEEEFGIPVVTSNQATFWASLRAAGIADRFGSFGALLADH